MVLLWCGAETNRGVLVVYVFDWFFRVLVLPLLLDLILDLIFNGAVFAVRLGEDNR